MRDPELADSIIKALRTDLAEAEKRVEMLTFALERIRDIDWLQYSNRIDAIQQIAREVLQ
jgi:predicted RNase H-like nuclease (RuvC/YqgF family)